MSPFVLHAWGPTSRSSELKLDEVSSGPGQPDSFSEGAKAASPPKVEVPSANPPRLPETPVEPAYHLPSSQGHKVGDGCMWGRWWAGVGGGEVGMPGHPGGQQLWENDRIDSCLEQATHPGCGDSCLGELGWGSECGEGSW